MESYNEQWVSYVYRIIYSFHMPVFIFITGMFAKFDMGKLLKRLILPYVVFQTIYLLFQAILFGDSFNLQYTTPYWLLWYLLVVIFYNMMIPVLPKHDSRWVIPVLSVSVITALIIGYIEVIGYFLSLSRFFYFLPFFLFGYYYNSIFEKKLKEPNIKRNAVIVCFLIIIMGVIYICIHAVSNRALYGSFSYSDSASTIIDRMVILLTSVGWILLFECLIPDKKIPLISDFGQNTMPIFLLHGFVIKITEMMNLFRFSQIINMLLTCVITMMLIFAFGNKYVSKVFRKLF